MAGSQLRKSPDFKPRYLAEFGAPPPGASLAKHYAAADRKTQSWIRSSLLPKATKEAFERWVVGSEPWEFFARKDQLEPEGDWQIWMMQAGRGAGKTRAGSEWTFRQAATGPGPGWQIGVCSPTFDDLTRVTFGGPSGLMPLVEKHSHLIRRVNKRPWEIEFMHGPKILSYTGEAYERLRGPNHAAFWLDEVAGMARVASEVFEQIMFGLRIGRRARMLITTTPKPIPLFKRLNDRFLAGDPGIRITFASIFDNADNLSAAALSELRASYEGTRLGEQELFGKLLLDVPGALWRPEFFQEASVPEHLDRIVVGVDPSGAQNASSKSDEIGIVVAGVRFGKTKGEDQYYLLQDLSMVGSPQQWASRVVKAYEDWSADRVVAEANFGGGMVEATIKTEGPNVPVRLVTASRGKQVRAEPVATIFEQKRGWTIGRSFTKLIDQACSMTTSGYVGEGSPDRIDAGVWAITDLMGGARAPVVTAMPVQQSSYWRDGPT
jgi:phage terminase large subunit-like protein